MVTIVSSGSIDWSAIALLLSAVAAVVALSYHSRTLKESVRPVVWLAQGLLDAEGRLHIITENMGVGPAANVAVRLWLIPIDHPPPLDEQQRLRDSEWPGLRDTPPHATTGRPMRPQSMTTLRTFPSVSLDSSHAIAIFELEVTDVHGRCHTGITLPRRWRGRQFGRRPKPKPGTFVVVRGVPTVIQEASDMPLRSATKSSDTRPAR